MGTSFLNASAFKRPHHLLSIIPAYCLLLAPVIDRLFFGVISTAGRGARVACRVLPALLAVGGIAGGVMVRQKYAGLFVPYSIAVVAVFLVWTAACWAYPRDRRLSSFALLNQGVPVAALVIWPALGKAAGLNAEADALAAAFREHGIGATDAIYWVDGRQSFSIQFYHDLKIRRLINEIDMAGLREGRREVSESVYAEIARRVQERLKDNPPAYFIVSAGQYDLLSRRTEVNCREVFRLQRFHEDAEDELVVFTQASELTGERAP